MEAQLGGLRGVDRALIYGSWARRYYGDPGPLPQGIDLVIVGSGDVGEIRAAADSASRTLRRDVNVTVLRPAEWSRGAKPFIAYLKSEPLVELDLGR